MSEENVEVARQAAVAAVRRPKPDFDTVNALYDPDHELVSGISRVEGRTYRGAQGFREYLIDMRDTFGESWRVSIEGGRSIDDERVLLIVVGKAQGSGSGVPVEQRMGQIHTLRDGKVTRTEVYASPDEALEAAGLSE